MSEVEEEPARPLEVFDTNVEMSKRVAFKKSMVVFSEVSEPMQRNLESKMGMFIHMFQNDKATTLEQTEFNLALVKREPDLTLLKKDIKGVPSHDQLRKLRQNHMDKRDGKVEEKETIIEKLVKKVSPKKPQGKKAGKKKGKGK